MAQKSFRGCKNYVLKPALLFDFVISTAEKAARRRGAFPSFTCLVDPESVYKTSLGVETDIVKKEMFRLASGDFVLRPEGTANLLNAFLADLDSHHSPLPSKHFYTGPMFRYERPQMGRYRQFWQFGVEFLGPKPHLADDIELVSLAFEILEHLGVRSRVTCLANNIGDHTARRRFGEHIRAHFDQNPLKKERLSQDSLRRLTANPLRILDSKDPQDQQLVGELRPIGEFVSPESTKNFDIFLGAMQDAGLPVQVDPTLVRGLDYYNDLCFEFVVDDPSKKAHAVLAGGRYDGLASLLRPNSRQVRGTGFAMGVDRLLDHFHELISIRAAGQTTPMRAGFLILEDNQCLSQAMSVRRRVGLWGGEQVLVEVVCGTPKEIGKKLELLWERGCAFSFIVGGDEAAAGEVVLRDLSRKTQVRLKLEELEARTPREVFGASPDSKPFYGA